MKIDRLIGIVMFLLTRDRITANELAEFYEVSERTIYRDFDAISKAGIPVVSLQGSGGGYGLVEGYTINRQFLDKKDAATILASLKSVYQISGDSRYREAENKIESIIPPNQRKDLLGEMEYLDFDFVPWGLDEGFKKKMNDLYEAAKSGKLCEILYYSTKDECIKRTVEPHVVRFKENAWYLSAYCRLRGGFRTFKITRIREYSVLKENFVRKKEPGPGDWDRTVSGKIERIVVVFSPEAKLRVEDYFGFETLTYLADGRIRLELYADPDTWIKGLILSFGPMAEVLEPKRYREEIAGFLRQTLDVYNSQKKSKSGEKND